MLISVVNAPGKLALVHRFNIYAELVSLILYYTYTTTVNQQVIHLKILSLKGKGNYVSHI